MEDRGINHIFVATGVVAGYAWNISPNDETYIFHSVSSIGCELRFSFDIDLIALPILVSNNVESVVSKLQLTYLNRHFASAILTILIEDRRTARAERINNSRNIVTMHPGDIFMDRTAIHGDKAIDKVAKIRYAVRGLFLIVRGTSRDSYILQKLIKLDSPELKFISEDLYIFHPL